MLCEHREDFSFCVGGFLSLVAVVVVDVIGFIFAVDVKVLHGA